MVEVELSNDTPTAILIPFTMITAILIFVHLFSLVIATRLLPELEAVVRQPKFLFTSSISRGHTWPVQLVWYLSNIVGILLFLVELVFVAFVKFYPHENTQQDRFYIGIATLGVVIMLSVIAAPFIVIFFRSISNKKIQLIEQRLERGRVLLDNLNQTNRQAGVLSESVSSVGTPQDDIHQYSTSRSINTQV